MRDRALLSCLIIFFSFMLCDCSNTVLPKLGEKADKILVLKSKRELHLLKEQKILRIYKIALGANPIGHKQFEGDKKTPEGLYKIVQHNPKSQFYKSLRISYPNERDRENAIKEGKSAGSDIMIHGLGSFFAFCL